MIQSAAVFKKKKKKSKISACLSAGSRRPFCAGRCDCKSGLLGAESAFVLLGLFAKAQGTRLSATTTSAWQGPLRFRASALGMLSPLTGNKPTFTFTCTFGRFPAAVWSRMFISPGYFLGGRPFPRLGNQFLIVATTSPRCRDNIATSQHRSICELSKTSTRHILAAAAYSHKSRWGRF